MQSSENNNEIVELQKKEQKLKVDELELKIKELKRPDYLRLNFWTSAIAVLIALGGVIGQNYLSSIKNERAKRETEKANDEMKKVLEKKASLDDSVSQAMFQLDSVQHKLIFSKQDYDYIQGQKDSLQKIIEKIIIVNDSAKVSSIAVNKIKALTQQAQKELAPLPPRVFIQIADESQREKAQNLQNALKAQGFLAPGIENVGAKGRPVPQSSIVKYFRQEEKEEALKIVTAMKTMGIETQLSTQATGNNTGIRQRQYEVWFSRF